jgi:hypothetical protein
LCFFLMCSLILSSRSRMPRGSMSAGGRDDGRGGERAPPQLAAVAVPLM